ncbi:MAG: S-layer homology domain-containing protein [Agathobaculum sp.]|jgi:hypothetical protein|uniref:S-layer homology domain-containing protein n=1 Tax=Agathobaculum sp. TaxID=2048138 RepID=UPI003D8DEDC0
MKKRIISLLLALLFVIAPASAAFSDISDSKLAQTASVLNALGIMEGVGGNRFDPNSALTRAQFCKLAVTALGFNDVSAYGSYTIFPDVKSNHWAAKYINAAVRHPDLQKQAIIRGYADGSFGPDKTVSLGEACTMLLRMLGYMEKDIGPFWPADYIARAQSIGLTKGVVTSDPKAAVKRSDAATLLMNTLGAPLKDNEGSMLLDKVAAGTVKDCILLATSQTDSSLAANEARFFEGGSINSRKTAGTLDRSLIGVHGTIVIGKGGENVALGIVPNSNKQEVLSVRTVAADRITTDAQTLRPSRDTTLYVARENKSGSYNEMWASIQPNDKLTLYYDEYGTLQLMAVLPSAGISGAHSFVYGVANSASIPQEYKIVKNGAVIERSQLKKYDVVTLDSVNRQALISDARISGQYLEGGPTVSYPQTVTLYGQEYFISESAAETFKNIKLKDYITLLFNESGDVVAAYPKSEVSADMQGIITAVNGQKATVALTNGLTLSVETDVEKLNDLMGRLVSVGQSSNGKAYLTKKSFSGKASGSWSVESGKLGNSAVSPKVRIYEEVLSGAPLAAVSLSDISAMTVASKDIRYTVADSAGTITTIVMGDVTGESWIYGIGYGSTKPVDSSDLDGQATTYDTYYVSVTHWDGSKTLSDEYRVLSLPSGLGGKPVGIPKGYTSGSDTVNSSLSTLPLTLVDTVGVSAFDGSSGVRTKNGYYDLADDIGVYVTARKEFISLQNAKSNYSSFRVYANKTAQEGGKIRVIIAS